MNANTNRSKSQITAVALAIVALAVIITTILLTRPLLAQVLGSKPTLVPTVAPPDATPTPEETSTPATGSINGRVWHDLCALGGGEGGAPLTPSAGCVPNSAGGYQANGLLEADEPGLAGVLVQLGADACPATGLATTVTGLDGTFTFDGLSAGTYCVSIDTLRDENALLLPGGWTFPAVGESDSVASYTVTLPEGEQRFGLNFGWDYQFLPLPESDPTATPQPSATPTVSATPLPPTGCTNAATFVRDVTIPDGTRLLPGQSFIKTWRLRNSGTCTWTRDYALAFAGGDKLGGADAIPLANVVSPGDTVDLSVMLTAPTGDGTYQGKWQLRSATGLRFGLGREANAPFWVKIVVGTAPTATPTPPAFNQWRGEYYANRDLAGTPVLVRDDAAVNFNWGNAAPAAGLPSDGFSARWTRALPFQAGTHRFYVRSDDGVRVWLNGELIIDRWHDASGVIYAAERNLSAASYALRVEYYENGGDARIQFWWERPGDSQWRGEYFANTLLSGAPALVRNDAEISFNWGQGTPAAGLPKDGFSARWTRVLPFDEGLYRFRVAVDDGARLWVDDVLVIDTWRDGSWREVTGDVRLGAGYHSLRLEYYERADQATLRLWWDKVSLVSYPDWKGEYWANPNLSGSPAVVRNDAKLDFDWGHNAPAAGLPSDGFSARWTRRVVFDPDVYRFHLIVDDGARLWVDDRLVIGAWRDGASRELTADVPLTAGAHSLRLEFYERADRARVRLWWEKVTPAAYPDWKGEYFANRDLNGRPALLRNDEAIDFRWGNGAAAAGLPTDHFSVRWSRQVTLNPGVYLFSAQADDGIRFYLDGQRLLNEWHNNDGKKVYTIDRTLSGSHTLAVEYYEAGGGALVKFWWKRVGDLSTPTATPTLVPTATPTATPLPPTPTATATTVPPTPTPTATTVPPTPTATATPLPPKPTATAMPEPTPTVLAVVLNEILPAPAAVDWDGDGAISAQDEWIELHNTAEDPVDLSGWALSDGTTRYPIPDGTVLVPGAFEVLYRGQTGLVLDDEGGTLRLIDPEDEIVQVIVFGALGPDASYSRDLTGDWHTDWPPSPGRLNRPVPPSSDPMPIPGTAIAR